MTNDQQDQRAHALARSGAVCPICHGSIYQYGAPQYAHKIANTKANRAKYGSFIIDHTLNGEYVCSLACNQSCNIGYNRGKILALLADIVMYEIRK